ncbi:MAG: cation transporter, partial [Marmoricola sp.]|nr:cation transporter [Marmoricola sp.]
MGSGHDHGHDAGRAEDRSRLRVVLLVTLTVAVVELVGAFLSGSLAQLADAGHMFTDTAAIVVALS